MVPRVVAHPSTCEIRKATASNSRDQQLTNGNPVRDLVKVPPRAKCRTVLGGSPSPETLRYGAEGNGPSIYLRDPEGNGIELKGPVTD